MACTISHEWLVIIKLLTCQVCCNCGATKSWNTWENGTCPAKMHMKRYTGQSLVTTIFSNFVNCILYMLCIAVAKRFTLSFKPINILFSCVTTAYKTWSMVACCIQSPQSTWNTSTLDSNRVFSGLSCTRGIPPPYADPPHRYRLPSTKTDASPWRAVGSYLLAVWNMTISAAINIQLIGLRERVAISSETDL